MSYAFDIDPPLGQLRAFVVLAEELHFGRAAMRLGGPSPGEPRVRALEDELGVELFELQARASPLRIGRRCRK